MKMIKRLTPPHTHTKKDLFAQCGKAEEEAHCYSSATLEKEEKRNFFTFTSDFK